MAARKQILDNNNNVIFPITDTEAVRNTQGGGTLESRLSNFVTNSVSNLVNYYLKSETYTKQEVANLIGAIQQFHYEIYSALPQTGQGNVLYLIGPTGSGSDKYEEYVYSSNAFTKIGDTSIDLSGYVTTTALNNALANYTTTANLTTLLNDKADKTNVITLVGTTIVQVLADNTIYNCGELTALTITLPSTVEIDYISQINFTSGATETELTASATIIWDGDSINTDGEFEPEVNTRYTVMLYSDGTNVLGIVRGTAIPTSQNNN